MASLTSSQLIELISNGGNIIINANEFTFSQIRDMVIAGKQNGASMTIRKTNSLTSSQCYELARLSPTKVTFDFTC